MGALFRTGRVGKWRVLAATAALLALGACDNTAQTADAGADSQAADSKGAAGGDSAATADQATDGPVIPDGGSVTVEVDGTIGPWAQACLQAPQLCDDGNPCTADGCDPIAGCTAVVKNCADEDPCTLDKCDVKTGDCLHTADACDDNNLCTEGSCTAGSGCTFQPANCADGDLCTSDGCSPQTGCGHAPLDCNDGKTCTTDFCDPKKGCVNQAPGGVKCCEIAADCEDGDVCTAESCSAGVCKAISKFGCCKSANDCDDANACTSDTCSQATGQCDHKPKTTAGCCAADIDCDDATACTLDKCINNACGHEPTCCQISADCAATVQGVESCADATCTVQGCSSQAKLESNGAPPAGCCSPNVAKSGMEDGEAWLPTFVPSAGGMWAMAAGAGKTGQAAVFKKVAEGVPGGGSVAQLRMPQVTLPVGVQTTLQFSVKGSLGPGDQMRLRATTQVGSWWVWQGGSNPNVWITYNVDLTALGARAATHKVALTLEIIGGKGSDLGIAADDFIITSTCKPKPCSIDAQCNDSFGFSADACVQGACKYAAGKEYCEPTAGPSCDDGNPCTSDFCNNFMCYHSKISGCCVSVKDCDDNHVCTMDTCIGSQCQHNKQPADQCCEIPADCDDKKVCTQDLCPVVGQACAHTQTDANCCDLVGDCDDGNKCTAEACTKNQCSHKNICCKDAKDCDDGDPVCTDDACIGGFCQWTKLKKPQCCEPTILTSDFEAGPPAFLTFTATSSNVKWQVVSGQMAKSGKSALYYGDTSKWNFEDAQGQKSVGTVTTAPPVALPADAKLKLSFWLWMDTEMGGFDDLMVEILPAGAATKTLWKKSTNPPGFSTLNWFFVEVDLTPYAGQTAALTIRFDTIDSIGNSGKGVFIDDLLLSRSCD